jgi:MerR family transcriptional regulator/heat shock protein HspR|tara:strand:- start:9916 stop:10287 length:372 start_codon:yes stop_codon:yes gene_type:complete
MQWDFSEPNIEGVYVISVASKMLSMHPQTLRKYERVGLVRPSRTDGMLRLYSQDDIARLKLIKYLVDDLGLNLAGVRLILNIFNDLLDIKKGNEILKGSQLKIFLDEKLYEIFETLGLEYDRN